jgi:hypothetical protein
MFWWEKAKKQTTTELIKDLRNDATKNMMATFMGESNFICKLSWFECDTNHLHIGLRLLGRMQGK